MKQQDTKRKKVLCLKIEKEKLSNNQKREKKSKPEEERPTPQRW